MTGIVMGTEARTLQTGRGSVRGRALARLDRRYVWHPFTQMKEWTATEPIVIKAGSGAWLEDVRGRKFLDANSSIWTNLHGHNHPEINSALRAQLEKIAHSSALGLANEPASLLAEKLVRLAQADAARQFRPKQPRLEKVFYSDDGATAMEAAVKMAYEFARRERGLVKPKFLSLAGGYHGDTLGAVSLGHIDLFHQAYAGLLFKSDQVMAPYCYRCPFNRARPDRADARQYRRCQWECVGLVEKKFVRQQQRGGGYAALVVEPLVQGAAGIVPQPSGWLRQVAQIARAHRALLIADEVMSGFGRAGAGAGKAPVFFACHQEGVQPDLMALAKGMTGGYLPMAATLTTREIFRAFLGRHDEFKTFFHGHSYTANQLGAAASLASLDLVIRPAAVARRRRLEKTFGLALQQLWKLPQVGDVRQIGLIAGIELVKNWRTREPFPITARAGWRVCQAMARNRVLARPIGDIIVLMPPYCATEEEIHLLLNATAKAIQGSLHRGCA